jgi:carbamoyltransferase
MFYSLLTFYSGFKVNTGEYKFMGLAPYGKARYTEIIKTKIFVSDNRGNFYLNRNLLNLTGSPQFNINAIEEILGHKKRGASDPITQFHADIACSTQVVLEEYLFQLIGTHLPKVTTENICIAGGVGLNAVANGKISRYFGENRFFAMPASGDAGTSLGAAMLKINQGKSVKISFDLKGASLGNSYNVEQCKKVLSEKNLSYLDIKEPELLVRVSQLLIDGLVGGWFSGPSEFGPRALGNRSIIADPRIRNGQIHINQKIKFRESFRPFAPIVMAEYAAKFFDLNFESPYMLKTCQTLNFSINYD